MPDFLDEHVETRIQEGIESHLRSKQHDEHSQPPQHPIITTVIAEPMVPADATSHEANKLNPANPSETLTHKVCGLRPFLLLAFVTVFVVGGHRGLLDDVAGQSSVPNTQLLEMLEPWVLRSDSGESDRAVFQDPSSPQA